MKWILIYCFSSLIFFASSQCPTFSYTVGGNFCKEEIIDITNVTDGSEYMWDFCSGDIASGFTGQSIASNPAFSRNRSIKIIEEDDKWYAFAISQTNSNLQRIGLGTDLSNPVITYTDLTSYSGALDGPYDFDMIYDGTIWRAFVANTDGGNIVRLDFNNGIEMPPDLVDLGNFSSAIQSPVHIFTIIQDDNYFVFVSDGDDLVRVSYGTDITNNTPTVDVFNVAGSGTLRGFSLIKDCDNWVGLILSYSDRVYSVDFGTELNNAPTFNQLTTSNTIRFPANVILLNEAANYYAFVQGALGHFYEFDFSNSISDFVFTDSSVSDASFTSNSNFSLDIVEDSSSWHGFNFNLDNSQLIRFSFPNNCSASEYLSTRQYPTGISYSENGTYNISTKFVDFTGSVTYDINTITISNDLAPSTAFTVNDSRCVSNAITFTPSNSGLTSYSWDFDGDDIEDSTDPTPSFDYSVAGGGPGPGTYTVRVDVSDGTCDNFYEEEVTIYPDPPVPVFTVTASECVNTDITFTNDTDESQHMGVISYKWDFDNDGTIDSTDPNPTFAYTTSGTKTVVLYDTIPGCSNVSATFDIDISPGPTAGFAPSTTSACEGETISFTDTSSMDVIDYSWDFGNETFSTVQNPEPVLYLNSGLFNVTLRTTDSQGCEDTFVQEISIAASPQISIDFDIPCTSPDGVQFFDLTTVEGADIVSWSWEVDGEEVSTAQNPIINFSSTGLKDIDLTVLSSNGCESWAREQIEVLTAPSPDFSIDLGCQGETTSFIDETESAGNPIVSWLWTVDGANYGTQDISHVFETPGNFDVTLEVTGQNFCSETITKNIEIIALPTVAFAVNGECDNQIIRAVDESTTSDDPIVSRRWMLDGANVGNGAELLLDEMEDGSYELELEVETAFGCLINSSQTLEINDAPESSFTSSRIYGIPGDQLTFNNNSTGGSSYQWFLDGALRSTESGSESITFPNPGNYLVSLVAENSLGCYDTTNQEILIAVPEVDLAIGSFELVNENNTGKIFMEIQNLSNLPVEITEAQLVLENEFRVSEQIVEFIGVGESSLVSLNVGIPLTVSEPSYFCVSLSSQYVGYDDINPVNNEKCLTIQPEVQVEEPFPNPVTNQFRLKVVVPSDGVANLRLINSAGKTQRENFYEATTGLNNFFIDMSTLNAGIYYVVVDVMGNTYKRKVIKL